MKRKRFSVEQIVAVVKQAEMGISVPELIRQVGISEQTFYRWKKRYTGLEVDQVRQLKQLQEENVRLKRVVADLTLDKVIRHQRTTGLSSSASAWFDASVIGAARIRRRRCGCGFGRSPRLESATAIERSGCC